MRSCSTCRFSSPALAEDLEGDDTPVLECRRFPPTLMVTDDGWAQFWPQMAERDWCGEWRTSVDTSEAARS